MIGIVSLENDVETWANPLIADIAKYEPDVEVRLTVSEPGEGSYAASINELGNYWYNETTDPYFMPMNADVTCFGKFAENILKVPETTLCGMTINERDGLTWIDGWMYIIPRAVWKGVGEFDENFQIACFEDADYTWRARQEGFRIAHVTLPFHHHQASPRMRVKNFWKIRKENQVYLIKKWDLGPEWSYR